MNSLLRAPLNLIIRLTLFHLLLSKISYKIYAKSSILEALNGTLYCASLRRSILNNIITENEISNSIATANKVLVIVLTSARTSRISWNNFKFNILDNLKADLALSVETLNHHTRNKNPFRENAKFVWEMDSPPNNDYMHYFNEVSQYCFQHPFDASYTKVYTPVNKRGWLGCVTAAESTEKNGVCGVTQIFFRWFALQKIIAHGLYRLYDKVVVTRSDYMWVVPHSTVLDINTVKRNELYAPEGEDYDGLNDRHHVMTMYDAINTLDLLDGVIENSDPTKQLEWMIKNNFNWKKGNVECIINFWHREVKHQTIHRIKAGGFLIADMYEDETTRKHLGSHNTKPVNLCGNIVYVKYPSELKRVQDNGFIPCQLSSNVNSSQQGQLFKLENPSTRNLDMTSTLPEGFSNEEYKALNPNLSHLKGDELARHYIIQGVKEKRLYSCSNLEVPKKYQFSQSTMKIVMQQQLSAPIVICTVLLNEKLYVDEWILYHRAIGVDHIYIYDNNLIDTFGYLNQSYPGFVSVYHWPGKLSQIPAYEHFHSLHKTEPLWVAMIDCDEFLVFRDNRTAKEYIHHIIANASLDKSNVMKGSLVGSVFISWYRFGADGETNYSTGYVLDRFRTREMVLNSGKTIIYAPALIVESLLFLHYVMVKPGWHSVYADGQPCGNSKYFLFAHRDKAFYEKCPGFRAPTDQTAVIHHYFTKSWEEWVKKVQRGRAKSLYMRKINEFFIVNKVPEKKKMDKNKMVYDDRAWIFCDKTTNAQLKIINELS